MHDYYFIVDSTDYQLRNFIPLIKLMYNAFVTDTKQLTHKYFPVSHYDTFNFIYKLDTRKEEKYQWKHRWQQLSNQTVKCIMNTDHFEEVFSTYIAIEMPLYNSTQFKLSNHDNNKTLSPLWQICWWCAVIGSLQIVKNYPLY